MFPIKYIENNLVFNHDGECFAYYELIPYNYSFLSPEEKYQVHDSFRQLIAQNRDGKIHALQISTESSIRATQERSKKLITGRLREIACAKLDEQTDALVEMIGVNQMDYRFFLGFKLLVNEEELSLKSMRKSAHMSVADFLYEINHKLMGDFLSMSNDEINRFLKMEKLLESKIARRFKIRRLEANDFGYLMEHLYGTTGIAYEDYTYDLPVKKLKRDTLIKRYDLLRPTRSLVEESQRYLTLCSEEQTTYAAYFTINNIVGELDFPSSEIFYYQQQQFTFPIDTSMNVEIVANKKALSTVRWKETLPDIAHEINIVNLSSDRENKGLLDPFVIMSDIKDAESLAIDILTFLTGISSRDGEKFPLLRKAIRSVAQGNVRGLLLVLDELRKENNPVASGIADHIDSFTDYDFAQLLFSDGMVGNSISLEKQLNIIQVADLVLPDAETTFAEYTTMELLSVAILLTISTFALDFIHLDRSVFKMVDLDEAWSFLQVTQGKTLSNKLVRAGRSMNAGVYFVTQNADDLLDEKMKNNIGLKLAFRSTDINEIKKTLEFFGVDKDDEANQKRLRDLENGQCLICDLYGRVGIVQIHPVFSDLFHAFDTRPPKQQEETR